MHIAYYHYLSGGDTASHHARQFTEAARSLGHRVDAYGMGSAEWPAPHSGSMPLGVKIRAALKRPLRRYLHEPRRLLQNGPEFLREMRQLRANTPDVLLTRPRYLGVSSIATGRRLRLPLVVEVNAPVAEARLYRDQYFHLPWLPEALMAWTLHRADAVTAVSSALKEYLVEQHALPEEKITVVPNGADVRRFRPDLACDPKLPMRFRQNPVVGFVGSFQKFHGPELLAGMALRVAEARRDVHFIFVGDGPQAATVRRMTDPLGDRILFTGSVAHENVAGLVAAFDIAVLPETAFYCSPLKVFEWMAAGKAVVAPDYGPLEEIIESGREGLLFAQKDEEALVRSVLELVDRPDLRRELGRRAAARARASLTWEENARRVIGVCERAIETCRGSDKRGA